MQRLWHMPAALRPSDKLKEVVVPVSTLATVRLERLSVAARPVLAMVRLECPSLAK